MPINGITVVKSLFALNLSRLLIRRRLPRIQMSRDLLGFFLLMAWTIIVFPIPLSCYSQIPLFTDSAKRELKGSVEMSCAMVRRCEMLGILVRNFSLNRTSITWHSERRDKGMGDKYGLSSPSSGYYFIEAPFGAREVFDYPTFRILIWPTCPISR